MTKKPKTSPRRRSKRTGRRFLGEAFRLEQRVLQTQLELSSQSITHGGVKGAVSEGHFLALLRRYLPQRYAVDTAIAIDSAGKTSDQIDVVVFDQQYTPCLLDQRNHRFVPAEAIYAVFEVKPRIDRQYLAYAGAKAASVRRLKRTSVAIQHAGGQFPPKTLFPIIAGIVAPSSAWPGGLGPAFQKAWESLSDNRQLDCGLALSAGCFDSYDGKHEIYAGTGPMARFLFRFLQKLQSLGTVPAVDWNAYGRVLGPPPRNKTK